VQRRRCLEQLGELFGVRGGDLGGIERLPQPSGQLGRGPEGPLKGDLLVEDHADEEGERVLAE
jgi:hypothetical protein